jgi:type I restriction enzyme S subunit
MNLRKDNWKKLPLGDVCELYQPKTISGKDLIPDGKYNVWGANGIIGKYNEYNQEDEQVLISCRGEKCGVINYSEKQAWVTGNSMVARPIEESKLDKRFLFFLLSGTDLSPVINGTAQPQITRKSIEVFKIPIPSPKEQKQIAALFQSIETAMEQVDGQEKNLHKLKHKLLKDLFNEKQEFGNHLKAKDFETVKFEKIAINISERVEPKKTELATYVGLEHLDADNLKIERTGTPDDVIGTKLKIYEGDIIFGKRRAYLRKVAVSHFDGIASAHSMILRANEKNIEKDFLPYFMQSDTFMSRAVQISEGSLSPTIKNKTLAVQEFILPKKEKQKELISVFKQFDATMEQLKQQKTTLKNLKQKLLNEILG